MDDSTDRPQTPTPEPSPRPPVDPRGPISPPPPPPGAWAAAHHGPPPGRSPWLSRLVASVAVAILVVSLGINFYLGVLVAALTTGPTESTYVEGDANQRIVILPIEGLIDSGKARFVHDALRVLRRNRPRALVLRVESGGGFVGPSDQIWNELERFRQEVDIPVIASFGSLAASGGYYVAASSDAIVAEPTTLTGSIGVIAQAFTIEELLDKIGVTPEVIASTRSTEKDMLNPLRPWTQQDRDKLRNVLDHAYDRFVEVVHQGRSGVGLTLRDVESLATGEAYTVDRAIALKLVDQEGYIDDAIALAQARAGIPAGATPKVTVMGPPRTFGIGRLLGATDSPGLSDVNAAQLRNWALEISTPRRMYQAP